MILKGTLYFLISGHNAIVKLFKNGANLTWSGMYGYRLKRGHWPKLLSKGKNTFSSGGAEGKGGTYEYV